VLLLLLLLLLVWTAVLGISTVFHQVTPCRASAGAAAVMTASAGLASVCNTVSCSSSSSSGGSGGRTLLQCLVDRLHTVEEVLRGLIQDDGLPTWPLLTGCVFFDDKQR
jgi:hypothetical protein